MLRPLLRLSWYWTWTKGKASTLVPMILLGLAFVALGALVKYSRNDSSLVGENGYRFWASFSLTVLIPLLCVFRGVGLLREDIENKTLVYVTTRPCGRVFPFFVKWLVSVAALAVSGALTIQILFWGTVPLQQTDPFSPFLATIWDMRALLAAVTTYTTAGMLFSLLGKRANAIAVSYVLILDSLTVFLPGDLRLLSLKAITLSLCSSKMADAPSNELGKWFQQASNLNEVHASLAAVTLVLVSWGIIAYVLKNVEIGHERIAGAV